MNPMFWGFADCATCARHSQAMKRMPINIHAVSLAQKSTATLWWLDRGAGLRRTRRPQKPSTRKRTNPNFSLGSWESGERAAVRSGKERSRMGSTVCVCVCVRENVP
jgi:hypothetical protein